MNELWDKIIEDYKIARKCRGKESFILCKSFIIDGMGNVF